MADYLRFAALGDSTTVGLGDRIADGWRGWSRLVVAALAEHHAVSNLNVAEVGATAQVVRHTQLAAALAHHPRLASLVVGVNDTMRSGWDPRAQREDLLHCAGALAGHGATLLLVRFPDMANLPLPGLLSRPLAGRIDQVNQNVDAVAARFDSVVVDLARVPGVSGAAMWSVDRLHPSELGHRRLADAFAIALRTRGIPAARVPEQRDGMPDSLLTDVHWMLTKATPWVGRRVRDLGPAALRYSAARLTDRRPTPTPPGTRSGRRSAKV